LSVDTLTDSSPPAYEALRREICKLSNTKNSKQNLEHFIGNRQTVGWLAHKIYVTRKIVSFVSRNLPPVVIGAFDTRHLIV